MSFFRNLLDVATGRVLRFNNAKQKCQRDLFFVAESCALAEVGQIHSPPTTTAFKLAIAGIISPIRWFSQIQSDGQAQFRPYAFFDNSVQLQHVIGSLQGYFLRGLKARSIGLLQSSYDPEERMQSARIFRFFEETDGLNLLKTYYLPTLYGTIIDPGDFTFEEVFDPRRNVLLKVHETLFLRYAELRGLASNDRDARIAWLWIVNSTLHDYFELVDHLYLNFESVYHSERKYAFGS